MQISLDTSIVTKPEFNLEAILYMSYQLRSHQPLNMLAVLPGTVGSVAGWVL